MKERIQKILANAGRASRRHIEAMVLDGRVIVNGRIVRELPILIDPATDKVDVDGERVKLAASESKRIYILMNKPKGVYSTNVAQGAQVRTVDLLPKNLGVKVYPVGRLDAQSKGLVLLTNDGELTNQLTHPRYGVPKTYRATVDGYITPQAIAELEKGVWMADKGGETVRAGRSRIRIVHRTKLKSVLEISIREGRNPQLRPAFARLGHKVRELVRIKLGPLTLEHLAPGRFRELTGREIKQLKGLSAGAGRKRGEESGSTEEV